MNGVCAFTAVCEEDAGWMPQYLAEAERLELPFVIHLDRCSDWTKSRFAGHPLCAGWTSQDNPEIEFTEQHKQAAFDHVVYLAYSWAFAWDVDETYERDAAARIWHCTEMHHAADCLDTRWLNLWDSPGFIRVDGTWTEGHRVKLYNLQNGRQWRFDHPITNGAKLVGREASVAKVDLVTLHWGMMTPELRRQHKERWDRIYSTALKGDRNPYGFWKDALETEDKAITVRHGYR